MDVYLVRHAAAIDETRELRDPMRYLTPEGRRQATSLGDRLRWHDCVPTQVWTSPLVRAVQTAELIVKALSLDVAVDVLPLLAPGESLREAHKVVTELPRESVVLLVGHEPGMSGIGALLTRTPDFAALAKAEAARIVDGALRWRCAWNAEAPVR